MNHIKISGSIKISLPNGAIRTSAAGEKYEVARGATFEFEASEIFVEATNMEISGYLPGFPQPQPFDLEAAKRGDPLVTRDGRAARFVGYEKAATKFPVAAHIEGKNSIHAFTEKGSFFDSKVGEADIDLLMAPKPKRTVWVNLVKNGLATWHNNHETCTRNIDRDGMLAVAVPVEIDA